MRLSTTLFVLFFMPLVVVAQIDECTIGVASGRATADGRPLLWKTRDMSSAPDNKIQYITSKGYRYISVTNSGNATIPWMGVNEYGFAIINSMSSDLPKGNKTGLRNGSFMGLALTSCKTIEDFHALLEKTNGEGRRTIANFGVIDTTGAAAIFETGHQVYWRYNAAYAPDGYILRTNFAINGGGKSGIERFRRTTKLIGDIHSGDSLSVQTIIRHQMRDYSDKKSAPVAIPFDGSWKGRAHGYIDTRYSICRNSSVSASVIHGVLPQERAKLTTFWTLLGQPATSLFIPYWPVGAPPKEATGETTAPIDEIANQIRTCVYNLTGHKRYIDTYKLVDEQGDGLWSLTLPFEEEVFFLTSSRMERWRKKPSLLVDDMKLLSDSIAAEAYHLLLDGYEKLQCPGIIPGHDVSPE